MRGEGPITIAARSLDIDAHDRLKPGRYVCLSVTDAGEGMDADTLKRAAEPFFTTKGIGKGTGLGLSMVHGVAEESGGALILRSRPKQGTTAEIWLPAFEPATQMSPQPAPVAPPLAQQESRYTILACDDDPLILMSVLDMLEDLGHTVVGVGSGVEALEAMERQRFDLVVTDHAMPRMTGAQLIAEIKRRAPATPVILASGYAELPNGDEIDAARLAKPFSQTDLAAAIGKAIRARR
jgi:CheY-like chemotaxis protein